MDEPTILASFRNLLGENERGCDQFLINGDPAEREGRKMSLEELQQERGRLLLNTFQCERVRMVRMAQLALLHTLMRDPERKLEQDINTELAQLKSKSLGPRDKIKKILPKN